GRWSHDARQAAQRRGHGRLAACLFSLRCYLDAVFLRPGGFFTGTGGMKGPSPPMSCSNRTRPTSVWLVEAYSTTGVGLIRILCGASLTTSSSQPGVSLARLQAGQRPDAFE